MCNTLILQHSHKVQRYAHQSFDVLNAHCSHYTTMALYIMQTTGASLDMPAHTFTHIDTILQMPFVLNLGHVKLNLLNIPFMGMILAFISSLLNQIWFKCLISWWNAHTWCLVMFTAHTYAHMYILRSYHWCWGTCGHAWGWGSSVELARVLAGIYPEPRGRREPLKSNPIT